MAKTYSISEGARLLGVSPATLSRRLPPERARRGRAAHLSVQELVDLAPVVDADPATVRRLADVEDFGADMPPEAHEWARAVAERDLISAVAAHLARIPDDLLEGEAAPGAEPEVPEPWGDPKDWAEITSQQELDALVPPDAA